MGKRAEAGVLLKYSKYAGRHNFWTYAVNRVIKERERPFFVPHEPVRQILGRRPEMHLGHISFLSASPQFPSAKETKFEINFHPYLNLWNIVKDAPSSSMFYLLSRNALASRLELRALLHLKKFFNGNILHREPSIARKKMLAATGRASALSRRSEGLPIEFEISALNHYGKKRIRK